MHRMKPPPKLVSLHPPRHRPKMSLLAELEAPGKKSRVIVAIEKLIFEPGSAINGSLRIADATVANPRAGHPFNILTDDWIEHGFFPPFFFSFWRLVIIPVGGKSAAVAQGPRRQMVVKDRTSRIQSLLYYQTRQ